MTTTMTSRNELLAEIENDLNALISFAQDEKNDAEYRRNPSDYQRAQTRQSLLVKALINIKQVKKV